MRYSDWERCTDSDSVAIDHQGTVIDRLVDHTNSQEDLGFRAALLCDRCLLEDVDQELVLDAAADLDSVTAVADSVVRKSLLVVVVAVVGCLAYRSCTLVDLHLLLLRSRSVAFR